MVGIHEMFLLRHPETTGENFERAQFLERILIGAWVWMALHLPDKVYTMSQILLLVLRVSKIDKALIGEGGDRSNDDNGSEDGYLDLLRSGTFVRNCMCNTCLRYMYSCIRIANFLMHFRYHHCFL